MDNDLTTGARKVNAIYTPPRPIKIQQYSVQIGKENLDFPQVINTSNLYPIETMKPTNFCFNLNK